MLVAPKAGPQLPPHLQTADDVDYIDRSLYDNGVGDSRGYYQDGAYTAAPDPDSASSLPEVEEEEEEGEYPATASPDDPTTTTAAANANPDLVARRSAALRRAYYASLKSQFLALRSLLHRPPPPEAVAALPRSHGTEVGAFGPRSRTFSVWSRRIRHTDPLPAQVAALDGRRGALRLLRVILGGKFLRRGCALRERTSRWIWALLARLPDRGELGHAEVGWVRELGKRAVLMMVSMAQMAALWEEVGEAIEGDDGEGDEVDDYLGEMVVNEDDNEEVEEGETGSAKSSADAGTTSSAAAADHPAIDEDENGEMDMDLDDGEISDGPAAAEGSRDAVAADIAAAKARLLARLEEPTETQQDEPDKQAAAAAASTARPDADEQDHENDGEKQTVSDETRALINMRATLNMILTVAGEFYGQRDLLEFRDPFPSL